MHKVPFVKYTSFGNNFVIVDETSMPLLTEAEKANFAYHATNGNFGIGCDNFLVIQPCTTDTLKQINAVHHYWDTIPDAGAADFVFRMFEPNGTEAFSCGNGLMCVASYLFRTYGIQNARIMTEIPTSTARVISIGTAPGRGLNWANMGHPRKMPPELADPSITIPYDQEIDFVQEIEVTGFRESDSALFFSKENCLKVTGFLVFTGEPHFVVFTETGFSLKEPAEHLFPSLCEGQPGLNGEERRINSSTALVDFIGKYFERVYGKFFPAGININFVRRVGQTNALEYRCFERGINRETLACGTGALAVAFVARRLNIVDANPVKVWPHCCRWYQRDAEIQIEKRDHGWILYGRPMMLFDGVYTFDQQEITEKTPFFPELSETDGIAGSYHRAVYH